MSEYNDGVELLGERKRFLRAKVSVPVQTATGQWLLNDFLPPEWRLDNSPGPIRLSAYRSFVAARGRDSLVFGKPFHLLDSIALVAFVDMPYIDPRLSVDPWDGEPSVGMTVRGADEVLSFRGCAFLLLTKESEGEQETRHAVDEAIGLARAVLGPNVAYDRVFELIFESPTVASAVTNTIIDPASLPSRDLSPPDLSLLEEASRRYVNLSPHTRRLVGLALQWSQEGMHQSGAVGFLHRWVGIETLGIDRGTNVRRVNEILAAVYEVTTASAADEFLVGRLQGIRSAIVHGGIRPSPPAPVLDYLDALFADLLLYRIGARPEHRARKCLTPEVISFVRQKLDSSKERRDEDGGHGADGQS